MALPLYHPLHTSISPLLSHFHNLTYFFFIFNSSIYSSCSSTHSFMDTIKPSKTTKLSKTFHNLLPFKKSTKSNPFCLLLPTHHNKFNENNFKNNNNYESSSHRHFNKHLVCNTKTASMDAFVAKLFATISSLKAAYAELQAAQFPYNAEAVRCADQAVVDDLKAISEMKRSFLKNQIDPSPPQVTFLLAEIQEQQSLMKMYEITMNKMEKEIKSKEFQLSSLRKELSEADSANKSVEKRLNSSGCFPIMDHVELSDLTPRNFVDVVHYALRSITSFVKLLVRDMVNAHWDIEAAVKAIEPGVVFSKPSYRCFAIESYVTREMFVGFNDDDGNDEGDRVRWFDRFKKMKSLTMGQLMKEDPRSEFGRFARAKYMRLVHPKMEASLYGNLSQRKTLNTWQFPDTAFFGAFTEMARRVWVLRCLAAAFGREVGVFEVRRGCRFSEVYMESVTDDGGQGVGGDEVRVAFTVVPGFKIGETVVQSHVYVAAAAVAVARR